MGQECPILSGTVELCVVKVIKGINIYGIYMTSLTLLYTADFTTFDGGDFTRIRGFASSRYGSIMYVCIVGGKILKSTDLGASWTDTGLANGGYTSIACSSDGTIVYVADLGQGLYKSTNSGSTWSYITRGAALPSDTNGNNVERDHGYTTYNVYQIACDATGSKVIMTTNYCAYIYKSIDGGVTWTNLYTISVTTTSSSPVLLASNIDGTILYAAFNNTDAKIYKSLDSGATWNILSTLGTVSGPFKGLSTNLTGDFCFACGSDGALNIFYETHAVKSVLVPQGGSLVTAATNYNNGNNIVVMENNKSETYSVTNLFPPGPVPGDPVVNISCFKEGSKILCYKEGREVYVNIEKIRKGDLIKTARNGYLPVDMIGKRRFENPKFVSSREKNRLYICTPYEYPELTNDLIITGCHAILKDIITEEQKRKMLDLLGNIYVTDHKYRLPACLDERAKPFLQQGDFNIWHIALQNDDYYMNYGIYANGLLVESCSKRFLKELSGMSLV
jgi:hypothetical protein